MDAREQVRRRVEALGRKHVGTSWWVDLAGALVEEFTPVVEERDRYQEVLESIAKRMPLPGPHGDPCHCSIHQARAAVDAKEGTDG